MEHKNGPVQVDDDGVHLRDNPHERFCWRPLGLLFARLSYIAATAACFDLLKIEILKSGLTRKEFVVASMLRTEVGPGEYVRLEFGSWRTHNL